MYDTVIIGGGPAGLSASVYAKRAGLNALLIEESPIMGGQVLSTYEVDNYLGIPGVSGLEISERFSEHAKTMGIDKLEARVDKIIPTEDGYRIAAKSLEISTKTVVLATGASHAHLGAPGEEALSGMGVSYCATCDGAFFKKQNVCVIGGSDVAVEDAIYLARTSRRVFLIHRRDTFRAANSLVESLKKCENVSFILNSEVTSFNGDGELSSVTVKNKLTGEKEELEVAGAFVAVGIKPATDLVKDLCSLDEGGYVIASEDCRTNRKGLYVAGDIRKKPMRQIITAVADGANAISSVSEDLR